MWGKLNVSSCQQCFLRDWGSMQVKPQEGVDELQLREGAGSWSHVSPREFRAWQRAPAAAQPKQRGRCLSRHLVCSLRGDNVRLQWSGEGARTQ